MTQFEYSITTYFRRVGGRGHTEHRWFYEAHEGVEVIVMLASDGEIHLGARRRIGDEWVYGLGLPPLNPEQARKLQTMISHALEKQAKQG